MMSITRIQQNLLILIAFLAILADSIVPAWWSSIAQLGVHYSPEEPIFDLEVRSRCHTLKGLSAGQTRICELFSDHMPAVGKGALHAIHECQFQFKSRRWNCSTTDDQAEPEESESLGPSHIFGTKEAAYTYAIVSAGVTHQVSRTCREGNLKTCRCTPEPRPLDVKPDWNWRGCSDNLHYGYQFSQNFIDIREREQPFKKNTSEYARSLMNRWNNEVGRKLIKKKSLVTCKCHGVSGSCNLRTCWRQLPNIRDVGDELLEKYEQALRVKVNRRGNLQVIEETETPDYYRAKYRKFTRKKRRRASRMDLVFLDDSPDYCSPIPGLGTMGTSGRFCNFTGPNDHSVDSCNALCCGRGHNTFTQHRVEKCNCKFEWCCRVVCKQCHSIVTLHMCK